MGEMNDLGSYILRLAPKLKDLTAENMRIEDEIKEMHALLGGFDKRRLAKGELTGDKFLDAALCFSHILPKEDSSWIICTKLVYERLLEVKNRVETFSGILLYDGSEPLKAYRPEIKIGRIKNHKLYPVFFDEEYDEPPLKDVKIRIAPCVEILDVHPVCDISGRREPFDMDVARMFKPFYWRQDDLRLYLGKDEINGFIQKLERSSKETGLSDNRRDIEALLKKLRPVLEEELRD